MTHQVEAPVAVHVRAVLVAANPADLVARGAKAERWIVDLERIELRGRQQRHRDAALRLGIDRREFAAARLDFDIDLLHRGGNPRDDQGITAVRLAVQPGDRRQAAAPKKVRPAAYGYRVSPV